MMLGHRLARAILTRVAGRLDRRGEPWGAAMLAELSQARGSWEALRWALGGLRLAWRRPAPRRRRAPARAGATRRLRGPGVLAATSGVSAVMTGVFLAPGARTAAVAGAAAAGRLGPAGRDAIAAVLLTVLELLAASVALSAAVAIAAGRVRLAKRLLEIAAVLGCFPAVWVGLLAAGARGWLALAARAATREGALPRGGC
jgi:hypothetical protein